MSSFPGFSQAPPRALRTDFTVISCGKGGLSDAQRNKSSSQPQDWHREFRKKAQWTQKMLNLGFHQCLICHEIILKEPANEEDKEAHCQNIRCSAYFHLKCIRTWINRGNDNCPQCRIAPFFTPPLPLIDGVLTPNRRIEDDEFVQRLRAHNSATLIELKKCDLTDCNWLTDTSLQALAQSCPQLQSLKLFRCDRITDAGVTEVAQGCPNLQSLHLDFCYTITDAGVTEVARGCPHLRSLSLYWCSRITDAGLSKVAQGCLQLEWADLSGCRQITDEGVRKVVQGCLDLDLLTLTDCDKISSELITDLQNSHPHIYISKDD